MADLITQTQIADLTDTYQTAVYQKSAITSYQHIRGGEIVLAGHALLQFLGHLFDILNFIQQIQDMFVLNAFDPQLAQFIPLAMQKHLTGQQILLHLERA